MLTTELSARFGQIVADRRRSLGMTQEELAARAGVHRTYIGDIENGRKSPTIDRASAVAAALGESLGRLLVVAEVSSES